MTPDQAKDALVLNPKKFLATNLLVVFGSGLTVRPPGPTIFKLAWTDTALGHGTRLKFVEKTRDLWSAKISLDNNGGNPAKGTKFAAGEFVAYYIPMMQVRNCVSGYPPPMDRCVCY